MKNTLKEIDYLILHVYTALACIISTPRFIRKLKKKKRIKLKTVLLHTFHLIWKVSLGAPFIWPWATSKQKSLVKLHLIWKVTKYGENEKKEKRYFLIKREGKILG